MSTPTDAFGSSSSFNNSFSLLNICLKVELDDTNYNDWMCNIKTPIHFEDKEYVLERPLDEIDEEKATRWTSTLWRNTVIELVKKRTRW